MKYSNLHGKQKGFVLPVGMIMLSVLTIIGISSMKNSAMQERMASNYMDKEQSFQAAESALRVVQRRSLRTSYDNIAATPDFFSVPDNPTGVPDYANLTVAEWRDAGWPVTAVAAETRSDDGQLYAVPKAVIQEMSNTSSLKEGKELENNELAKRYYRVTAFSVGETETATTTLQGVVVQE